MSDILLYGALAALGAVLITSPKGKQAVNTVVDTVKPAPKPNKPTGLSIIKPTIIGAAPLPILTKPPVTTKPPATPAKPPATTPTGSKKTATVNLPIAAEPFRAEFKAAAFAQNMPFTLLIALCETVNPKFDKNFVKVDQRLLTSSVVIKLSGSDSQYRNALATRCGLSGIAVIHAREFGYARSQPILDPKYNLEYGAKYLKKCLGLFTTSDRQIRAFVAYYFGFDAAKNPNAEHLAFAKKVYVRWQELES
jgi:hypothetical protein